MASKTVRKVGRPRKKGRNSSIPIPSSFVDDDALLSVQQKQQSSSPVILLSTSPTTTADELLQQEELKQQEPVVLSLSTSTTNGNSNIKYHWSIKELQILDQFLILHFHRNKTNIISLHEFYIIAKKALIQIRTTSTTINNKDNKIDKSITLLEEVSTDDKDCTTINDLTEEERILYELIMTTSPMLYKLRNISSSSSNSKIFATIDPDNKDDMNVTTKYSTNNNNNEVICIEFIKVVIKDRTKVWKLISNQRNNNNNSNKSNLLSLQEDTLTLIRTNKEKKKKKEETKNNDVQQSFIKKSDILVTNNNSTTTTKSSINVDKEILTIHSGMTIDERVKVRDAIRKLELENNNRSIPKTSSDIDWLLIITDSIWSITNKYNNNNRRNNNNKKKTTNNNNNTNSTITMILKDVVTELRQAIKALGKIQQQGIDNACSKRRIVEVIIELHNRFPKWIQLSSLTSQGNNNINKDEPSPNTLLTIHPIEYSMVRTTLSSSNKSPLLKAITTSNHSSNNNNNNRKRHRSSAINSLLFPSSQRRNHNNNNNNVKSLNKMKQQENKKIRLNNDTIQSRIGVKNKHGNNDETKKTTSQKHLHMSENNKLK